VLPTTTERSTGTGVLDNLGNFPVLLVRFVISASGSAHKLRTKNPTITEDSDGIQS
jgi:hypothetical protein